MSTTFGEFWRMVAAALHDAEEHTLTSSAASLSTATSLVNTTTDASTSTYDERWMYVSEGFATGTQNRVAQDGYDPAAGSLVPQNSWDTTPHVGDVLALTSLFPVRPPETPGGSTSYLDLLKQAARLLIAPDRIDVTTVANQQSYSLSTYSYWLDRADRVLEVHDSPRRSGWPTQRTGRQWEVRWDGGTPTLVFLDRAYPSSGYTFQLAVIRPGDSLVNGSESRGVISSESDTVLPSLQDLVDVGLWLAYRDLLMRSFGRPSGNWQTLMEAQEKRVNDLATIDRTRWVQAKRDDVASVRRPMPRQSGTEVASGTA